MPLALIEAAHCNVDLKPSPIEPSWIIEEGNPEARSHLLSSSACGTATTVIWSCTEGKFNWYYDLEETIVILEEMIVLESDGMPPKRYGAGDVVVFRDGAHAKWHVERCVKKVAFLRRTNPFGLVFSRPRRQQAAKRTFFGPGGRRSGRVSVIGAGLTTLRGLDSGRMACRSQRRFRRHAETSSPAPLHRSGGTE